MLWQNRFTTQNAVCHAPFDIGRGASETSNQEPLKAPAGGRLGIYTDTVVTPPSNSARFANRQRLYGQKRTAAKVIKTHVRQDHRVVKCKWTKCASKVGLRLNTYGEGDQTVQRATYDGLVICGNVWGCPVCSARISRVRQTEMNTALAWAKQNGLIPVMLTLTARHGRADRLDDLLDAMKEAKRGLRQRKIWRQIGVRGSVTATEITHGTANGWHPHFHEILLIDADNEEDALERVESVRGAWLSCLNKQGLNGAAAAFDVQGAAQAGKYIAKWGAAEELTLSGQKQAKGKGRTPRDLLDLIGEGDKQATALWLEYFAATSGRRRRQLVWSRGLKDLVGINDVDDEEIAGAEIADDQEPEYVASWSDNDTWRRVRPKMVRMMEAAETGGAAAVRRAEVGPDDDDDPDSEMLTLIDRDDRPRSAMTKGATRRAVVAVGARAASVCKDPPGSAQGLSACALALVVDCRASGRSPDRDRYF